MRKPKADVAKPAEDKPKKNPHPVPPVKDDEMSTTDDTGNGNPPPDEAPR